MALASRLFLLLLVLGCHLAAQTDANKAQVAGSIFDPQGAIVVNASVRIKNRNTGLLREMKSGERGEYRAALLDSGVYEIAVTSPSFAKTKLTGVTLTVGSAALTLLVTSAIWFVAQFVPAARWSN